MKNTFLLVTSCLLYGCGGGGDGSGDTASISVTSPTQPTSEEAAIVAKDFTPVMMSFITQLSSTTANTSNDYSQQDFGSDSSVTTSQLNVPAEFSFNPVAQIEVKADISAYRTDRAFVAFYSQYTSSGNGTYQAVYESRIASSALTLGIATLSFSYPLSQSSLLAEIWFYDGSAPLQQVFTPTQP
ncbi:hypothetical protein [Vibrio mimicus]|uniref:hypothetical protein n=1 Tax=Vibrio mimicus TaxID=674 RepID=UPI0001BADA38|nr:hypothetical protein [Vibrio mimicus]EEY38178.1 hypothetical protein VII_001932 [Vibrio mimicus MB451]